MGARWRTRGTVVAMVAAVVAASAFVATGEAGAGSSGGKFDPGINSPAALAAPNCDADREQVKFFYYAAAPCVKPWKEGADNGGATAQGVTKGAIKVVVLHNTPVPGPPTVSANFLVDQSTGKDGLPEDGILDYDAAYKSVYETWGRTVEYEFVQSGGSDEVARARRRGEGRGLEAVRGARPRQPRGQHRRRTHLPEGARGCGGADREPRDPLRPAEHVDPVHAPAGRVHR